MRQLHKSSPPLSKRASIKDTEVANWTCEEVCQFLAEQGMQEYQQTFMDEAIDGEALLVLTETDLKELGYIVLVGSLTATESKWATGRRYSYFLAYGQILHRIHQ